MAPLCHLLSKYMWKFYWVELHHHACTSKVSYLRNSAPPYFCYMILHSHAMSMGDWQDSWTLPRRKNRLIFEYNVDLNDLFVVQSPNCSISRSYIYCFINFSFNDWTHDAKMLIDFPTYVWCCKWAVQIWPEQHFLEQLRPLLHWGFVFPPLESNRRNKVVTQLKEL